MSAQIDESEGTAAFADALASSIIDLCEVFESMQTSTGSTKHHGVTAQVQKLLETGSKPEGPGELYYKDTYPCDSTSRQTSGEISTRDPPPIVGSPTVLIIAGDLSSMAERWTPAAFDAGRRVVVSEKQRREPTQTLSFRPLAADEDPRPSLCASCMYWAERGDWFVGSVDVTTLLEGLITAPVRFSVEENN